jgi:hypothetical protein
MVLSSRRVELWHAEVDKMRTAYKASIDPKDETSSSTTSSASGAIAPSLVRRERCSAARALQCQLRSVAKSRSCNRRKADAASVARIETVLLRFWRMLAAPRG